MRLVSCVLAGLAMMAISLSVPGTAKSAEDPPEVQSVARKSVKRSPRRAAQEKAKRSRPEVSEETGTEEIPIPRPKGLSKDETAIAFTLPTGSAAATAATAPAGATSSSGIAAPAAEPAKAIPKDPAIARTQLRTYYSVQVLADRCGFPVTTKEGNLLDRVVSGLERVLKLSEQQADALYSDVDLTLYSKGGGKICVTTGNEARVFRATLDSLSQE